MLYLGMCYMWGNTVFAWECLTNLIERKTILYCKLIKIVTVYKTINWDLDMK